MKWWEGGDNAKWEDKVKRKAREKSWKPEQSIQDFASKVMAEVSEKTEKMNEFMVTIWWSAKANYNLLNTSESSVWIYIDEIIIFIKIIRTITLKGLLYIDYYGSNYLIIHTKMI